VIVAAGDQERGFGRDPLIGVAGEMADDLDEAAVGNNMEKYPTDAG
jgi:hypothetical protein